MTERHEYLATKLAKGGQGAPLRTRWWPQHWMALMRCVVVADMRAAGNVPARERLVREAAEWASIIGREQEAALMTDHASLEDALIGAAGRKDSAEIERLGRLLMENADEQARIHALRIEGFPQERFRRLLEEHVALVAGAVRHRMEGDPKSFQDNDSRGRANSVALADLAAEWF